MLTGDLKLYVDQLSSLPALTGTLDVPISKNWGAHISGRKTYEDLIVQPLIERRSNQAIAFL